MVQLLHRTQETIIKKSNFMQHYHRIKLMQGGNVAQGARPVSVTVFIKDNFLFDSIMDSDSF